MFGRQKTFTESTRSKSRATRGSTPDRENGGVTTRRFRLLYSLILLLAEHEIRSFNIIYSTDPFLHSLSRTAFTAFGLGPTDTGICLF